MSRHLKKLVSEQFQIIFLDSFFPILSTLFKKNGIFIIPWTPKINMYDLARINSQMISLHKANSFMDEYTSCNDIKYSMLAINICCSMCAAAPYFCKFKRR